MYTYCPLYVCDGLLFIVYGLGYRVICVQRSSWHSAGIVKQTLTFVLHYSYCFRVFPLFLCEYMVYSYCCTDVILVRILLSSMTFSNNIYAPHAEQGDCSGDGVLYADDEHVRRQFAVQAIDRGIA